MQEAIDREPRRRGDPRQKRLKPGETHLHWIGLVPALLAVLAGFPFEVSPMWSVGVAVLVLAVFTVRLNAPRTGNAPVYAMHLVVLAVAMASFFFADEVGLSPRSRVGQFVSCAALSVILLPPETYRTFTACVVCLMSVVANGLMRTDLEYTTLLVGFLATLAGLMALGHAHESVRARGLHYRRAADGRTFLGRALGLGRSTLEAVLTLAAGFAIYLALPKPAVMPIADGRFASVANSFQDSVDVGRGPIPRGARPFLFVESERAPYLLSQVFDRYENGKWKRTPATEETLFDRTGVFALPAGLDAHGAPAQRASVRLARELPDLLLVPEGTTRLELNSWHVFGKPPLHLRAWTTTPLTTYAATWVPAARLAELVSPHLDLRALPAKQAALLARPPAPAAPEDPRVVALARAWAGAQTRPERQVAALVSKLGERCRYDTAALTPPGADPVVHFLFEARAGYCMHFATALAALCRAIGVPARLATGYAPGSAMEGVRPTTFAVKPRDAHAWNHVYIGGHGWVSVDATEGILVVSVRDQAEDLLAGDPLAPTAGFLLDMGRLRAVFASANAAGARVRDWLASAAGAGAALGATGLVLLWWRRRRSRAAAIALAAVAASGGAGTARTAPAGDPDARSVRAEPERDARVAPGPDGAPARTRAELAMRFDAVCAALAQRGAPSRESWETPREYARRATGIAPELARAAELLDRAVLGPEPVPVDVVDEMEALLARVAR